MNKIALITGATSGIGMASARLFAKNNIDLIICGRRKDRLKELQKELGGQVRVQTLNFDVRIQKEVEQALGSLSEEWKQIDILLNNAGNAHGLAPIQEGDVRDWDAMIDINVKGLLYVSKSIIPGMVHRKSGHIVNIGSIAGKEVYQQGNVYCASKHAVDALTTAMRIDLIKEGIKVSGIHPGLVETEFSVVRYKGDLERAKKVYEGLEPLKATDIAEIIFFAITRPPHVNIADLTVLASAQASAVIVERKV